MLQLNEVFDEFNGQRLLLLVDDVVLLTQFLTVENQYPIKVESTQHSLLKELYDSLFLAESICQQLDYPDYYLGVDERLYVQFAQVLEVAEAVGGVHARVFAELDHELEVEEVEDVSLAFGVDQLL
jgi:hypothetical protein